MRKLECFKHARHAAPKHGATSRNDVQIQELWVWTEFVAVAAGSDTEVLCPVEARRPTEAKTTTFSDGYLGSSIDEGRSEV